MKYSEQIKPISYLKANAAEVIKKLGETRNPIIITVNGEAKAVLQDVREYEENQETMAFLKLLSLRQKQIDSGEYDTLENVKAQLQVELGIE